MKATLSFSLPEETTEFELCSNAWKWKSLASDLAEEFRRATKNGHNFKTADEAIDAMKDKFYGLMTERDIFF